MDIKGMMGAAQKLTESAGGLAGKFLDEFNEALPTVHALGLNVRDLHVGMGLPPEIAAKLTGSVDAMDVAKIKDLAEKNRDKSALVALLKTLEAAYNIKDQLRDLHFQGVEIDFTLGLSPKINVGFVQ